MVKFGETLLPGIVLEIERLKPRIFNEKPIIGSELAARRDAGGLGRDFVIRGILTGTMEELAAGSTIIEGLADGTKRVLDLEDGTPTVTCLALDPTLTDTDKPFRREYEVRFTEAAP